MGDHQRFCRGVWLHLPQGRIASQLVVRQDLVLGLAPDRLTVATRSLKVDEPLGFAFKQSRERDELPYLPGT